MLDDSENDWTIAYLRLAINENCFSNCLVIISDLSYISKVTDKCNYESISV